MGYAIDLTPVLELLEKERKKRIVCSYCETRVIGAKCSNCGAPTKQTNNEV